MLKKEKTLGAVARDVAAALERTGVELTLGGEPTYVPFVPEGAEWSTTAVGPQKLGYAYRFARTVTEKVLERAIVFFSPGKSYPGETNPRWTLQLLWSRDGKALMRASNQLVTPPPPGLPRGTAQSRAAKAFRRDLTARLKVRAGWLRAEDPSRPDGEVWVLPLDHDGKRWQSVRWIGDKEEGLELLRAEGPAGLRLPLFRVPEGLSRRALVLEVREDGVDLFLPPLLQGPFEKLLGHLSKSLQLAGAGYRLQGYVPSDSADRWEKLSIAPDPGVIEVNLPACAGWEAYEQWIRALDECAAVAGLCPYKQFSVEESIGTGGGNHLLFGGPSLEKNGFFQNPRWVTSILRYWQQHPSLSYLFTGHYVGSSSQAPRPDESARALYDLEMAYQFLERLPEGDHRYMISETLRHLHTDGGGNTHRSEISFDKFWSVSWEGGCRGLIEFRAVETLPRADWTAAVGLLWQALAAHLLAQPCLQPLREHGAHLHDRFFLPAFLWEDLAAVLRDLRKGGFALPESVFREIWEWRFPKMLTFEHEGATLIVRKAHEDWPLLCETPIEGGTTSRFVDTSIERLEVLANAAFAERLRIRVQGRALELQAFPRRMMGSGVRYRRTMLYPSLHPGMPPHMPLRLSLRAGQRRWEFELREGRRRFEACDSADGPPRARACRKLNAELLTVDLRIV